MWDLIKIVIPKIEASWKHFAYSLEYDTVQSTCNVSLMSSSSRPCSCTPVQALAFAHMTTQQVLCEYSLSYSSIYATLLLNICWLTLVFSITSQIVGK